MNSNDNDDKDNEKKTTNVFDTWKSQWRNFQDDQRLERLQQCQVLSTILKECQQSSSSYNPDALEQVSGGLRIMKYFQWRGILHHHNKNNHQDDHENGVLPAMIRTAITKSCAREQHAVWACRAVAVGCGHELQQFKQALEEEKEEANTHHPYRILMEPQTAYEITTTTSSSSSSTDDAASTTTTTSQHIPAASFQSQLGACVTTHGNLLLQRTEARRRRGAAAATAKNDDAPAK